MRKIDFVVRFPGGARGYADSVRVAEGEDTVEQLVAAIMDAVETDISVEVGGITIPVCALRTPEHWDEEWDEVGIENPEVFIASLGEPV